MVKKVVIVNGLSGAGKTQALNILEDNNFFCVDNLPIGLFESFLQLIKTSKKDKFAVNIDIRAVDKPKDILEFYTRYLKKLNKIKNIKILKLFLEANITTLIKRFSETRRKHPLGGDLVSAIRKEKKILEKIKKQSDIIINTTDLTLQDLKQKIIELVEEQKTSAKLVISVVSFGYRSGLPLNADMVFDTRFLPNPNYVDDLKLLTGKSQKVKLYMLKFPVTLEFLEYVKQFLRFLLSKIILEGKNYFTIAFGCTGGRHRSVVIAEEIYNYFKKLKKEELFADRYILKLFHRDIQEE